VTRVNVLLLDFSYHGIYISRNKHFSYATFSPCTMHQLPLSRLELAKPQRSGAMSFLSIGKR
jgi:hypothetical protein